MDLNFARSIWSSLNLGANFYPKARFGNKSAYGKVYTTTANKLIKISPWSKNSAREMNIAKRAGAANVGPKVYNTRKISHKKQTWAVMTMDKVPNAKSLYNAINNGNITNFRVIWNVVAKMHRAGIHHGNLHGYNILVYKNANGTLKLVPIDFGAAKYHPKITNMSSAVKMAIQKRGWRGGSVIRGRNAAGPGYARPGREQLVRSNNNMLRNLKRYFNEVTANRGRVQRQVSIPLAV
jgi:tRNA A-37 threonylcarbamoyl transferase component Bud32